MMSPFIMADPGPVPVPAMVISPVVEAEAGALAGEAEDKHALLDVPPADKDSGSTLGATGAGALLGTALGGGGMGPLGLAGGWALAATSLAGGWVASDRD